MDSGSRAATVGDGAANFTSANLWLDLLNASGRWDGSGGIPAAEPRGGGLDEQQQQRLVREQSYRDFTTTIQVFILLGSLLGESVQTHQESGKDTKTTRDEIFTWIFAQFVLGLVENSLSLNVPMGLDCATLSHSK